MAAAVEATDPAVVELLVEATEVERVVGAGRWFVVGGADPEVVMRAALAGYLFRRPEIKGPDSIRLSHKAGELLGLLGRA